MSYIKNGNLIIYGLSDKITSQELLKIAPQLTNELMYNQVKQNFADFVFKITLVDSLGKMKTYIISKDVKISSTDGGSAGRISFIPELNTNTTEIPNYLNGITGYFGDVILKNKLDKINSPLLTQKKLIKKYPNNSQQYIEKFFNILKDNMLNVEIIKYVNISVAKDPGIDYPFINTILPKILQKIEVNAELFRNKTFIETFFSPKFSLNPYKNKIQMIYFIKEIIPEEFQQEMLDNLHKYIEHIPHEAF